jgi:nitrous oxidase accessory protein NosD
MAKIQIKFALLGCSLFGLLVILPFTGIPLAEVGEGIDHTSNAPQSGDYELHANIVIDGDAALAAFTPKTGSGTKDAPYVIQNLEINSTTLPIGIDIVNIHTYYLQITHCRVIVNYDSSMVNTVGIRVSQCGNVTVDNCIVTDFRKVYFVMMQGIVFNQDINCTVQNNLVTNFTYPSGGVFGIQGIVLSEVQNFTVQNNTISAMSSRALFGLCITSTNNTIISGNRITGCSQMEQINGLYLSGCGQCTIRGNFFSEISAVSLYCLRVASSKNLTITNNTIAGAFTVNNLYCIEMNEVESTLCADNTIRILQGSIHSGAWISSNKFRWGTISNNLLEGISASGSFSGITMATNFSQFIRNVIRELVAGIGSVGISLTANSTGNVVKGNIIAVGDVPAQDLGFSNMWAGYLYFNPLDDYRLVGNYYWNYTGKDTNMDCIGDTPQPIFNSNDPCPITYGIFDNDQDGLLNYLETGKYGTGLNTPDSDGDSLLDGAEANMYLTNPLMSDSDGDGLSDGAEINTYITNPLASDTDNDGLSDGAEVNAYHTLPLLADTDGDGILDSAEVEIYHTNALANDTDGDSWSDAKELFETGTDPCSRDTDGDGFPDAIDPNPLQVLVVPPLDYTVSIIGAASIIGGTLAFLGILWFFDIRKRAQACTILPERSTQK